MADNSSLPVASGNETFANDDIGGVKYPRPKINWGPDGTANDVDVASGKPLPVQLRSPTGVAVVLTAASTAPAATDPAVVVAMSPNTQNANGRASAANSTPVVLSNEDKAALIDDAAFTPGTSNVNMVGFQADEASTDSVDEGDAGAARMTLDRKIITTNQPHTKGGLLTFNSLDIDETEEDVKTSAGQLYGFHAANRTTSPLYLRFYNATAANVTVGSTATFAGPYEIPANASDHTVEVVGFGGLGIEFDTAISVSATTGFAANDTGAPATNACIVNVLYK